MEKQIQGFMFGRPMPVADFARFLVDRQVPPEPVVIAAA